MTPSQAARALGKLGGKSTSDAKAKAARKNGRKGGRPHVHKIAYANPQEGTDVCRCGAVRIGVKSWA